MIAAMMVAALVVAFVGALAVALIFSPQLLSKFGQDEQLSTSPTSSESSARPSPSPRTTISVPVTVANPLDTWLPGPPSSPLSDWEVIDMYEDENPQHHELMSPAGRHSREIRSRKAKGAESVRRMCKLKYA